MCTTTKIGATFGLNEDKIDNNAEVPPVDAPIAIISQERVLLGFVFLTGLLVSLLVPRGWTVAEAFSISTIRPHSDGEWIVPVQVTKNEYF